MFAAGDVAGGCPQKYVTGAMVEGEIAAKKIVFQLNEERDKEKASDESTEKKALDAKITEYNRYLSNEGGMYETEALEEARLLPSAAGLPGLTLPFIRSSIPAFPP